MNAQLEQIALAIRLRGVRVQTAELALNRRRRELEEALGELQSANELQDAWQGAAAALEHWAAASTNSLHRWSGMVDVRRQDFQRGCAEANRYVTWCEEQMAQAQEAERVARQAWSAERARLDALTRRHALEARRDAARTDEATFEELADAAAAGAPRGGR
ncbi:MAG: hypothetical protein ACK5PW_02555 [Burkholderiales bacterium]|jgi:hypothetical protein